MKNSFPLSFSRLIDFKTCPFYFKSKHLDKIPEFIKEELTNGHITHEILCEYAKECYAEGQTHLFEKWEEIAKSVLQKYPIDPESILESIKSYVEANEIQIEGLAGVEEEISITSDLQTCEWTSPLVWFRAKLDKLYLVGDQAIVQDYKTGFSMKYEELQAQIYAWLVFILYPQVEFVRVEFDFTRFAYKKDLGFSKQDLPKLEDRILHLINQAQNEDEFEPRMTSFCYFCSYTSICPAIQARKGLGFEIPKNAQDASELLKSIISIENDLEAKKNALRGIVGELGAIQVEDVEANYQKITKTKWDIPNLLDWSVENGVVITPALSVDNKKLKKVLDKNNLPTGIWEDKVSSQFRIGKKKEEKDLEN